MILHPSCLPIEQTIASLMSLDKPTLDLSPQHLGINDAHGQPVTAVTQKVSEMAKGPCADCGQPTTARTGICTQCQYARRGPAKARYGDDLPEAPCSVCGQPTRSFTGACQRTAACRTEHTARYNAGRPEVKARAARKWRRAHPERAREVDARNNANRKGSR